MKMKAFVCLPPRPGGAYPCLSLFRAFPPNTPFALLFK